MPPRPRPGCRPRVRPSRSPSRLDAVFTRAHARVVRAACAWARGLEARIAAKVLRRKGIHPWSLLLAVESGSRPGLARALGAPSWVLEALEGDTQGFTFVGMPRGRRLPEGLVTVAFEVLDSAHLERLPRRILASNLSVLRCRSLVHLPRRSPGLRGLHLTACPRVREIPAWPGLYHASLAHCATLERIQGSGDLAGLRLTRLPALRHLPRRMTVGTLRIWNCGRLVSLEGLRVEEELDLHGCAALRFPPRYEGTLKGVVRDCPSLQGPWPVRSPELLWEAWEGASFLPPVAELPRVQKAEVRPLPGLIPADGPAWPWPPPDPIGTFHPGALLPMLGVLGLAALEEARCLAGCGLELGGAVRFLLRQAPEPGAAVRLGAEMLKEAWRGQDDPAAAAVCLELERLGLGCRSALMLLDKAVVWGLVDVLGAELCSPFRQDHEPLGGLGRALAVLPGPLVLGAEPPLSWRCDPVREVRLDACPNLRILEGPVWVERSLWIRDCPDLERLPAILVVRGDLILEDCPALVGFPARLDVEGDLVLGGLPRLRAQVCRARVGGSVAREGVQGLTLLAERQTVSQPFPHAEP